MEFCEKHVVESILLRLPPKSLMRFKCVSKQWYALINNPKFAVNHLYYNNNNLSTTTRVLLKLRRHDDDDVVVDGYGVTWKDVVTLPWNSLVGLLNKASHEAGTSSSTSSDEHNAKYNKEVIFSILEFVGNGGDDDVVDNEHSSLATCEDITLPVTGPVLRSICVVGHCNGIVCLAMAISCDSCKVLLWNPAIRELKALPAVPYVPDFSDTRRWWIWSQFKEALGFGYCLNSNDYKVVNIVGLDEYEIIDSPTNVYDVPKVAVYTLSTDSWTDSRRPYSLETETGVLWPKRFQMYFKGMCFWIGEQHQKEVNTYSAMEQMTIWKMIISFHMEDEVFEAMALPDSLCDSQFYESLIVWNDSIALFGAEEEPTYGGLSFGIWVMDEAGLCKGAWTKHVTLDLAELCFSAVAFLKSDEILIADKHGCLFSYNLGTKNVKYFPDQRVSNGSASRFFFKRASGVYLDSIVSLLGDIRFKTEDDSKHDFSLFKYSPLSLLTIKTEWHSYSVWAFPPKEVSVRIKKIMDGLRSEFPGPEIEPHIPVIGCIHMTHDEVLSKFKSLQSSCVINSYTAKVNEVVTRNFYYHCVSLLIDSHSDELWDATMSCSLHFGFCHDPPMPRLSLICGYLSEEERKIAHEKVQTLDESITSLSFPITRLALYKVNHRDPTMKSWEKIAEYPLIC